MGMGRGRGWLCDIYGWAALQTGAYSLTHSAAYPDGESTDGMEQQSLIISKLVVSLISFHFFFKIPIPMSS